MEVILREQEARIIEKLRAAGVHTHEELRSIQDPPISKDHLLQLICQIRKRTDLRVLSIHGVGFTTDPVKSKGDYADQREGPQYLSCSNNIVFEILLAAKTPLTSLEVGERYWFGSPKNKRSRAYPVLARLIDLGYVVKVGKAYQPAPKIKSDNNFKDNKK